MFSALILTNRTNIYNIYLWNNCGRLSKYQDVMDFVKNNETDGRLVEFEDRIQAITDTDDNLDYELYKYRFKESRTFKEIAELLDMETPRISEHLDKISFALKIYCGI